MVLVEFISIYWIYLSIPVISALVGYGTNCQAVKMMFQPTEFQGIGSVGWQGVVPSNAHKMGKTLIETSMDNVIDQDEIVARIDLDELLAAINHRIDPLVEHIVDETLENTQIMGLSLSGFIWKACPLQIKEMVYKKVRQQIPNIIADITDDIKNNLDSFVDINDMALRRLLERKGLLSEIFYKVSGNELRFLRNSGFIFGLPLGIPVMFLWHYNPVWWLLPVSGLMVGYLTNVIAVELVQKPIYPRNILGFTFQGLFLKRQKEVSAELGKIFARDLLSAEALFSEAISKSQSSDKLFHTIEREVNHTVERIQGVIKPLVYLSTGGEEYDKMRRRIYVQVFEESTKADTKSFQYVDQTLDIENTMSTRLAAMPPEKFFRIFHPIVSEDTWKLFLVGAILGFGAGCLQWLLLRP